MPRLLLVEDDDSLRNALVILLSQSGYEVAAASNGRIALEQMARKRADLVITDMIMQEMEGVETIQTLRREYPNVKIIAVSGGGLHNGEPYLKLASKLGAQKTLAKPFQPEQLLDAIREVLG